MRTSFTYRTLVNLFFICFPTILFAAAPGNDNCGTTAATSPMLSSTSAGTCTSYSNGLKDATSSGVAVICGGSANDVWFRYTGKGTPLGVSLSGLGSSLGTGNTYMQVFSGSCGSLVSLGCSDATQTLTTSNLTNGIVYYIRIYTTAGTGTNGANKYDFTVCLYDPPAHDECTGAIALVPNTTCTSTASTLNLTTATTGLPVGCESAGTHYDGWYSFVATSTTHIVTISSLVGISNPEIQLYSGSCGSLASVQCGTTSLTATGLTVGNTYFVRVSNVGSIPTGSSFNICVTTPPSNDDCANATYLYSNTSCTNTAATLASASPSSGIPLGCAAAGTYYDVWFTFAAASTTETVAISGVTGVTTSAVQLFSGSCGALTSVSCGTSNLTATGLSVGATYYVRVSSVNTAATGSGNFNICVTHPAPSSSTIDYGKSYVNISKNAGGGTINPSDTLEIRATLVIKTGSSGLDSLSFVDTLHFGGGVRFLPGSIALRTNEGQVYKPFTDAATDDAGYFYTSGTDTVLRINFGTGASATARGRLLNTSKPSVFGSTCIIMATYRVVVYAGYGTTLNLGGGKITTKDVSSGALNDLPFSARNAIVFASPGLCSNAVSATNAISGDFSGTFGSGASQNRAPSSNVLGYTYATFTTGAPQDYYYGIANNTSAGGASFTTSTTWPKADNSSPTHRVFNVWDISGDHTGAVNPTKGNLPCDPSKPVSSTNPCGYMLVVNSAYKTDTAFQFSVSNLCPNTNYEISAWLKNICYKCGSDSNGVSATNPGTTYIPSALNDSSGIQPNLTFDINGVDYYTTGNIVYGGLFPSTQTGSDSNNTWIKRGFTYLTGPAQTSLKLTIRNNAPGGGGNDWAMDDIALATCLPNMTYTPSNNPTLCSNNAVTVTDRVQSVYNTYSNYKWQRSTDGGTIWIDVTAPATATPTFNGSQYEFTTSLSLNPSETQVSNNGDMYRAIVATTASNLTNANCNFTQGVATITLNILDCFPFLLNANLLSFSAKEKEKHALLQWTTTEEKGAVNFDVEKSTDGVNFLKIASVEGKNKPGPSTNEYSFKDPALLTQKTYYRIALSSVNGSRTLSHTVILQNSNDDFAVNGLVNPFSHTLAFDVELGKDANVETTLLDGTGTLLKKQGNSGRTGSTRISVPDVSGLSAGVYILQVQSGGKMITKKLIKQ